MECTQLTNIKIIIKSSSWMDFSDYAEIKDKDDWSANTWVVVS